MKSVPSRSIFLPIALVSGTIFSVFIIPLFLLQSGIVDSNQSSFLQETFQPILQDKERQSKEPMIRYVGLAIITSVSAGLLTADVLRRRSNRSISSPELSLELNERAASTTSMMAQSDLTNLSSALEEVPDTNDRSNERAVVESGISDAIQQYAETGFGHIDPNAMPPNPV